MAVLTTNQIVDSLDSFIKNVKDLNKSYYVYIGRPQPWPDDATPPPTNNSVQQTELNLYSDIVYGKLLFANTVSYMIPNNKWVANTVYDQYSASSVDLIDKTFYVVTSAYDVYKCLYNNSGAASTIQPALKSAIGTFQTGDGYIWKYMFTVDPTANTTFTSNTYIPVNPSANVQGNAVPGTIDYIGISDPGVNYEVFEEGFLAGVVNNYTVELPSTSSSFDGYYVGSSIYLKAGDASPQLRNITGYSGASRNVVVNPSFSTSVNLNLANIAGSISVGDTMTQNLVSVAYFYGMGYFSIGDTVIQSDTAAAGVITLANSSSITISPNTAGNSFVVNYPVYDTVQSGTVQSGTVNITSGNNWVVANTGTSFVAEYSVNSYILVGSNANNNLRRVTGVNSTIIVVDANTPFSSNLVGAAHYSLAYAAMPTSVIDTVVYGAVEYVNLTGIKLSFGNSLPVGVEFTTGEQVNMVDIHGVNQSANGTVSYANTGSMFLSNVNGTLLANLYLLGVSSNVMAHIISVDSFPNVTLTSPVGAFVSGQPVSSVTTNNTVEGTAIVIGSVYSPNELTEYIISPKITITGDGNGAEAYAYIDQSNNNPTRQLTSIVMLNVGNNYSFANVSISSNTLYGANGVLFASISPVNGHGSNAYVELGARYAGISVTFSNSTNESYEYPTYGSYRKIGIIENPSFATALLNLSDFKRIKLTVSNTAVNTFIISETVIQPSTNAAGTVVYANSTYVELDNVLSSFVANASIYGLYTTTTANVVAANVPYFNLSTNNQTLTLIENASPDGANAICMMTLAETVTNTQILVTNINGHLNSNATANAVIHDSTTNSYAQVMSIYVANGTVDRSTNFGHFFNQTARITLNSNSGAFAKNEQITQAVTNATALVMSSNSDIDVKFASSNGSFSIGNVLTDQTTGATAVVTYVNNSIYYLRCTSVAGAFGIGDSVINNLSIGGLLSVVYPALVLYDVDGDFQTSNNIITGSTTGATGISTVIGNIMYPDLVRGSGDSIYFENIVPFTRSNTSVEKINIVIKF